MSQILRQSLPRGAYVAAFRSRQSGADWVVGFYAGERGDSHRHAVVDGQGTPFDPEGFPFVLPISAERGEFLARHRRFLEVACPDLQGNLRCAKTGPRLTSG